MKVIYTLFFLTQPDVMSAETILHRFEFSNRDECMRVAKMITQERDPVVRKKNCIKVIKYNGDKRLIPEGDK